MSISIYPVLFLWRTLTQGFYPSFELVNDYASVVIYYTVCQCNKLCMYNVIPRETTKKLYKKIQ